ncbi:choice-of-anchor V domain-containing protein [Candidatus Kuenenia sp.]|uniref:choice-of-anchor V domain-containing protein n=1 Tax=Candidatus Kuenenia sp. TaxID=2499824 RepID=UPI0032203577
MKGLFTFAASVVFSLSMMSVGMNVAHAFLKGPEDGHTGSPADNFATCATAGCHDSFALNSGSAVFSISAPDTYTPGEEVSITVSFSDSSSAKHGFQLSALDAKNEHVGLFNNVDNKTQTGEGDYISHTERGTDGSSWTVVWMAPSSPADDPVTIYGAGNEANGNGTNKGDYIYTTTASMVAEDAVPGSCAAKSIEVPNSKIKLLFGESDEVTVTVTGANGCAAEGVKVTASLSKAGNKRVEISPESVETNENGEARFTITAKEKNGNAKVTFKADGIKGKKGKAKLVVKVRKK